MAGEFGGVDWQSTVSVFGGVSGGIPLKYLEWIVMYLHVGNILVRTGNAFFGSVYKGTMFS